MTCTRRSRWRSARTSAASRSVADLAKMPHLLIAGTTGSGKSVAINAMVLSLLYKSTAEHVRLIMIDPKMLELSVYEGIPHLLAPVVTDMKEAANALRWSVVEMDRRYQLMAALGVRNIVGFNKQGAATRTRSGKPIRDPVMMEMASMDPTFDQSTIPNLVPLPLHRRDHRRARRPDDDRRQEGGRADRAAGAEGARVGHPSGARHAAAVGGRDHRSRSRPTFLTRIAFQVSAKVDSRTILDQMGAETLLGHGDMLYLPSGTSMPHRCHGAFVSDQEVHRVVSALEGRRRRTISKRCCLDPRRRSQAFPVDDGDEGVGGVSGGNEQDALYDEAVQASSRRSASRRSRTCSAG